jgi:hypothetical protein
MRSTAHAVVSAVARPELLEAAKHAIAQGTLKPANHRPAAHQRAKVDEIQSVASAESAQKLAHAFDWDLLLQSLQAGEAEDGVVEIRAPIPINPCSGVMEVAFQKMANRVTGFAQLRDAAPCYLQHLDA